MNKVWNILKKIARIFIKSAKRLSRPDVFFYWGLWMMVLLVIGTVSQKYIGLYQAQLKYFSSFFFSFYGFPLPAGRTAMGIILISLVCKGLFSKSTKRQIGTNLVHAGAVLLLAGSFITGVFAKEGYMALLEGEKSNIISDYHKTELAVMLEGKTLSVFSEDLLVANTVLKKNIPFSLYVKKFMLNSEPVKRASPAGKNFKGFFKIFDLKNKKREKINEENLAGLVFQITRPTKQPQVDTEGDTQGNTEADTQGDTQADTQADTQGDTQGNTQADTEGNTQGDTQGNTENYAIFEQMPIAQSILWEGKKYTVHLRPVRTKLPFSIELKDFEKTYYPGTNKAKSYQSVVYVTEKEKGGTRLRRVIKMNQPLRHKGYTFYQSSFIESPKGESSVLAVVKNAGRAFPYVSSLIMCVGLLIHITLNQLVFPLRKKRKV